MVILSVQQVKSKRAADLRPDLDCGHGEHHDTKDMPARLQTTSNCKNLSKDHDKLPSTPLWLVIGQTTKTLGKHCDTKQPSLAAGKIY